MAENTGIFLVTCGVGRDLSIFYVIFCESGIVQHDAVFAVERFLHGVKDQWLAPVLGAYACHGAEALRLDEYLAFFVFMASNFFAKVVISAHKPLAVPAVLVYSFDHVVHMFLRL